MKRFLSFFLSLILMLGCLVIPADVLAAGIGSTSYSQQITVGYSWSTGKTTGNSMSCRVFFKNYDAAPITSYRVDMRFMDKAGNLLETVKGE